MVAASRIDLSHANAAGAHRRRGAMRRATARVRRDRMTPRAAAGLSGAARPFAAMQTGLPAHEVIEGFRPDQFTAVGRDDDYRNLWLSRHVAAIGRDSRKPFRSGGDTRV
jgi:hypothetical protein